MKYLVDLAKDWGIALVVVLAAAFTWQFISQPGPPELGPAPEEAGVVGRLTPREREVFQLLALGRSNKEVAVDLGVSVGTAKKHRENLQRKLDCRSSAELARLAIREGLLAP